MVAPKEACEDIKCPFHGTIAVKKELIRGKVVKRDINHSATIMWSKSRHIPKYERFEEKNFKLRVHNPACINAKIGDNVVAAKTRPLSKTKHHVIIGFVDEKKEGTKPIKEKKTEVKETKENESS